MLYGDRVIKKNDAGKGDKAYWGWEFLKICSWKASLRGNIEQIPWRMWWSKLY